MKTSIPNVSRIARRVGCTSAGMVISGVHHGPRRAVVAADEEYRVSNRSSISPRVERDPRARSDRSEAVGSGALAAGGVGELVQADGDDAKSPVNRNDDDDDRCSPTTTRN